VQEIFQDVTTKLKTLLWPDRYFAWQTLLLLSLFSLLMAAALDAIAGPNEVPFSVDVLSTLSWIFFTAAIWWALEDQDPIKINDFSLSPWITGIVLCLFLFRPLSDNRFRWAFSTWPLISTAIMALPDFVNWKLEFKLPSKPQTRQRLIMTLLVNLVLSSWILFYFRVQDWVNNYPSLLVSGLENSAFVDDFATDRDPQSQGVPLLTNMADAIKDELNGQPWYQTERWLYARQDRLMAISQRTLKTFSAPAEQVFWQMRVAQPRRVGEGYLLTMRADWLGPVAHDEGFFLEKTCKITPADRVRSVPNQPSNQSPNQPPATSPATSQTTVVDCGEEVPMVQWIKAG
jgi:hypothetical protein